MLSVGSASRLQLDVCRKLRYLSCGVDMTRTLKRTRDMLIKTASQAIDTLGGNAKVGDWLDVEVGKRHAPRPNTISGWRERGISRQFAIFFYAELVVKRGYELSPAVFGLDNWDVVFMPQRRKPKRVA